MDPKIIASGLAIVIAFVSYGFYIRSILRGETKPHIFTWLIYGLIDGIVFAAHLVGGGGVGAWPLGVSVIICSAIVLLSIKNGERTITLGDWACFIAACAAIGAWTVTDDPLWAVVILAVINVLGVIPTFRKSFLRPGEESIIPWAADIVRFALAMFALETFSVTTGLFPAGIIITNGVLVTMILMRRIFVRGQPS